MVGEPDHFMGVRGRKDPLPAPFGPVAPEVEALFESGEESEVAGLGLSGEDLRQADFTGADLRGALPEGANLDGAILEDTLR